VNWQPSAAGAWRALIARERATYRDKFPGSAKAFAAAGDHLLGGVPMTWMRMWSGGFPGAYGLAAELAERILADPAADIEDTGGVGGTLAGNALSAAAMRATLDEVLTDEAFRHMIAVATRYTNGVPDVLDSRRLPWTITQLGARAGYRFRATPHWTSTCTSTRSTGAS
jgi:glutamate-1-semialdehyde 2,1-aminomutase